MILLSNEEAAKEYADKLIGIGSEDDMHWQAVYRDFLAGYDTAEGKHREFYLNITF
jgi:hypothetical protein